MNPTNPPSNPDQGNLQGSSWVIFPEVNFVQFLEDIHQNYTTDQDAWVQSSYDKMMELSFHPIHSGNFLLLTEEPEAYPDQAALSLTSSLDWTAYETLSTLIANDATPHRNAQWQQLVCDSLHDVLLKQQEEVIKAAAKTLWQHYWKEVQEIECRNENPDSTTT